MTWPPSAASSPDRGWSDGLPVIPPTELRVAAMLAGTSRDPLEVVGILPPRRGEATVHAIAVNAVMAGCVPGHMPVLIAAVRAIAHPEFNLSGVNATTHPVSLFLLVSGPIAGELGIHSGSGCFGPGFASNATLGRALRLIQLTVAGAWPGRGDRSTQATPAKIAFCAAENLEESPWPPFQTTRGFAPEENAVTVFGTEGPHNIQDHGSNTALGIMLTIAGSMSQAGSNNILSRGSPVLAFGPEHAATVAAEGWSREDVQTLCLRARPLPPRRALRRPVRGHPGAHRPGCARAPLRAGRPRPYRGQPRIGPRHGRRRPRQALGLAPHLRQHDPPRHDAGRVGPAGAEG